MFKINELQDLFLDALVIDKHSRLVFCSLYGRDVALQQLFAAFSLPTSSGGLDSISVDHPGGKMTALVMGEDKLERFSGRLPRENIFGNISHAWLFDPACKAPDRVNRTAWILGESMSSEILRQRAWDMVKILSPLPLLEHWRDVVLDRTQVLDDDESRYLGRVFGFHLMLPTDFEARITDLVQSRQIGLEPALGSDRSRLSIAA